MGTDKKEFEKRCRIEERNALKNMEIFWSVHGKDTVSKFSKLTKRWPKKEEGKREPKALLQERLENSPILLITANQVEANMMVRRLSHEFRVNEHNSSEFSTITTEGCKFHFGFIGNNRVVHVQPKDMSSFTKYGSFSALESILKRYKPKLVISIGVAFGNDPTRQNLGDVLVSKQLLPYDSSNKYSENSIKLKGPLYETNSQLICGWMDLLEYKEFPKESIIGEECDDVTGSDLSDGHSERSNDLDTETFNWFCGTVLSGGSVVDEVEQKVKLIEATERRGIEDVVGGEMEGSGVYFACDKEKIPCIVIKGICDWGIKKNSWDEVLKGEENPPDNKTVKDCVQALAFTNAFSALRCLLEYDSTLISENDGAQDAPSISSVHLSTMKSFERIMMKFSTFNFLPYFFLGTAYILLSFLFRFSLCELLRPLIVSSNLENVLLGTSIILVFTLALAVELASFSKVSKRYKLKSFIIGAFSILIFGEVNIFLFVANIYLEMFINTANTDINKVITCFQFIYGGLLCAGGVAWIIAKHLRARPENLGLLFANLELKNLSFEKCCCIVKNTSEATLYNMSVGWICKTQLSPVQIHKCGTIRSNNNLLINYHNWSLIEQEILFTQMPETFCPIIPDTLQVNYRLPNGDLVVHVITKRPKDTVKRDSSKDNVFSVRYTEQILIHRDGIYEKVLKRVCYSQIISKAVEKEADARTV